MTATARTVALAALDEFEGNLKKFLQVLDVSVQQPELKVPERKLVETLTDAMSNLARSDERLQQSAAMVIEHQQRQKQIQVVIELNEDKDRIIHSLAERLQSIEEQLQNAIEDARPRISAWDRAKSNPISLEDVVNYAHKISYTTSAPPNWTPDKPLMAFRTPAPQEGIDLSTSLLYQTSLIHPALVGLQSKLKVVESIPQISSTAPVEAPVQTQEQLLNIVLASYPEFRQIPRPVLEMMVASFPKDWKQGDPLPAIPGVQQPVAASETQAGSRKRKEAPSISLDIDHDDDSDDEDS